jgi:hypothetical protein
VAGNKFVAGFTSITSAAGTTVLTAASTYYQRLVGTAIQTIQLPDATTCLVGTTFIFDNDSTGLLTITDGATGAIDVIPAGGVDYIYLISNTTVAGTWARYALLPSNYNFNATSADFGASTLSNGVWNGTPIAYNYGGTTLTTFVAANNALYSTSATALTAGTLPVLAGGTGVTTSTGSGNTVLSTSPTLVTPALGTPTSGTLTNCTFPTLNQNTTGSSGSCTGNAATATTANALNTANSYQGTKFIGGTNANPNTASTYGLQASGGYGGGVSLLDGANAIGLYSTSGTLNFGFGGSAAIASKATLDASGNFGATGTISGTNITTGGNVTGSSASCTGNAATATTATNLSGGTVAATTITATGNITAFFSDDRLKTRHGKIENALEKLQTLDGFYYTPNQVAQDLGYEAIQDVGVSAQSVQAILPEIIAPAPIDSKYLTVRYEKLVPLLIEAIKEQQQQIDDLRKAANL